MELLQPFIVTSWHGHRDDADIPAAVQTVWRSKFGGQRGPGPREQSNVDIALLSPDGAVVHSFDAFRPRSNEPPGRYTAREVRFALSKLDLPAGEREKRPVRLPDLGRGQRGVRLLVRLWEDRMIAYRAPVVEVIPLQEADWKILEWPTEERVIPASALKPWLAQIFPPGIMERTNPDTKVVYAIQSTKGELKFSPAKSGGEIREAILSGTVDLTDEGPDGFHYSGKVEIVLTYRIGEKIPASLRGYFDGIYPRYDRMHREQRMLKLQAAMESLPD